MKEQAKQNVIIKEALHKDTLNKLQEAKQLLQQQEEIAKKQAAEKKRAERKKREKNKSFEELLKENALDWRDFK